jgi:hypothetical protein
MSDIIERLRSPPFVHAGTAAPHLDERCVGWMREAADEIERLREEGTVALAMQLIENERLRLRVKFLEDELKCPAAPERKP